MKMSWWSYVLMLLVYLLYLFVGAGMLQNINLTIALAFYFITTTQKSFQRLRKSSHIFFVLKKFLKQVSMARIENSFLQNEKTFWLDFTVKLNILNIPCFQAPLIVVIFQHFQAEKWFSVTWNRMPNVHAATQLCSKLKFKKLILRTNIFTYLDSTSNFVKASKNTRKS